MAQIPSPLGWQKLLLGSENIYLKLHCAVRTYCRRTHDVYVCSLYLASLSRQFTALLELIHLALKEVFFFADLKESQRIFEEFSKFCRDISSSIKI